MHEMENTVSENLKAKKSTREANGPKPGLVESAICGSAFSMLYCQGDCLAEKGQPRNCAPSGGYDEILKKKEYRVKHEECDTLVNQFLCQAPSLASDHRACPTVLYHDEGLECQGGSPMHAVRLR